MSSDLIMMLLLGFTSGFGHCVGMCGGIVLTYSMNLSKNDPGTSRWMSNMIPHFLYSSGRTVTYMFLGGIFGLVGNTMTFASTAFNHQSILQIIAGIMMLYIGLNLLNVIPKIFSKWSYGNPFRRFTHQLLLHVDRSNIFLLGLVLGFLPCGVVYAAGMKAAVMGNPAEGMITMLAFALGTSPAMILTGVGAQWITGRFRHRIFKFSAVLVIILGLITIQKGVGKFNQPMHSADGKNAVPECCEPGSPHQTNNKSNISSYIR